jgi:hypothetical protein
MSNDGQKVIVFFKIIKQTRRAIFFKFTTVRTRHYSKDYSEQKGPTSNSSRLYRIVHIVQTTTGGTATAGPVIKPAYILHGTLQGEECVTRCHPVRPVERKNV